MSGIYIKGREMPENCQECFCLNDEYFFCQAVGRKPKDENILQRRPSWCPLVPVPPHGRMIDADKLLNDGTYHETPMIDVDGCWDDNIMCLEVNDIENAPTIIPADIISAEEGE